MYGEKYRKANTQPFEEIDRATDRLDAIAKDNAEALRQLSQALCGTEGFKRIDTCNTNCRQGRLCDCASGHADEAKLYEDRKPGMWQRVKASFNSFWRRHVIDKIEDHP